MVDQEGPSDGATALGVEDPVRARRPAVRPVVGQQREAEAGLVGVRAQRVERVARRR